MSDKLPTRRDIVVSWRLKNRIENSIVKALALQARGPKHECIASHEEIAHWIHAHIDPVHRHMKKLKQQGRINQIPRYVGRRCLSSSGN